MPVTLRPRPPRGLSRRSRPLRRSARPSAPLLLLRLVADNRRYLNLARCREAVGRGLILERFKRPDGDDLRIRAQPGLALHADIVPRRGTPTACAVAGEAWNRALRAAGVGVSDARPPGKRGATGSTGRAPSLGLPCLVDRPALHRDTHGLSVPRACLRDLAIARAHPSLGSAHPALPQGRRR